MRKARGFAMEGEPWTCAKRDGAALKAAVEPTRTYWRRVSADRRGRGCTGVAGHPLRLKDAGHQECH
jgi:hypothetical protein